MQTSNARTRQETLVIQIIYCYNNYLDAFVNNLFTKYRNFFIVAPLSGLLNFNSA